VNLNALDKRFFQHLLQPFGVGHDCCGRAWESNLTLKPELGAPSASWRNGRATASMTLAKPTSSASTVTVPDSILGQIQNIADQVEQVGAGAGEWCAPKIDFV